MKINKIIIGFSLALILLIAVEYLVYRYYGNNNEEETQISFVVTGSNLDAYENMQAGAKTASLDKTYIINFVNSPVDGGAQGEIDLINKQFVDGADYVVVVSAFYDEVNAYVKNNSLSSKVMFLKNASAKTSTNCLPEDYHAMADDLTDHIDAQDIQVLIAYSSKNINTNEILAFLESNFDDMEIDYDEIYLSENEEDNIRIMENEKDSLKYSSIIALDAAAVNASVKASSIDSRTVPIYGLDNSPQSVYYLDSGLLAAIVYTDDYSMGYMATSHIITGKSIGRLKKGVPLYYYIDRQSMYDDKFERVLFPFAK